jgi:non-specific protein-tyrosine kinase
VVIRDDSVEGVKTMETREYLGILKRRKWIVILTTLVTVGVIALGSAIQPPTYTAAAIVRVAQASSGSIAYADYMYADRLTNTYVQILTSRPVLEEVARRLDLAISAGALARQMKVEALPNTELLRITVEDTDPARARGVADTLAALLVEQSQSLYLGGTKSAREILQEQLGVIQDNLEQDRGALETLLNNPGGDQKEIDALQTRIPLEEEVYANLLQQYEEARIAEASRANSVTIVEPAVQPTTPSKPRMTLNIALGTLVGLVGGIGLAFLFENLDATLHSTDDLDKVTRVPILGSIPRFRVPRGTPAGITLFGYDGRSPAAEAYRVLRSNLLSIGLGTSQKTLLITSAEPGAGKSMVLVSLAAALAQAGRKVIVVDGDFRHSSLHQVFGLPNELGLSDVLLDLSRIDAALQETKIQGVRALTSGPLPPDPAELLGLSKMQELIKEVAKEADVVLLDAPPILAVADAVVLAPIVDGVLLVAAQDQATGRGVQRALQQLDTVGAKALGVVFDKTDAADGDHYDSSHVNITEKAASLIHSLRGQHSGRSE